MAGSLDELMRFLLGEIALCGQQGSTPADVLRYVSQFYQNSIEDAANATNSENCPVQTGTPKSPTIDRPFLEQIWKWLTKHPDVRIGRDGKGNKLPLSAVEAQYKPQAAVETHDAEHDASASSTLNSHTQQDQVSSYSSQHNLVKKRDALRVYVTEQRMWLAICGHSKDPTRVFDTEFALLSIIASHRENGILQGELVRESGQDKRSVPKRTDLLRDKGYIEKRPVHLKGLKTSWLLLRKFAPNITNDLAIPQLNPGDREENIQEEHVDIDLLIKSLFATLRDRQIVTRDDLKKELEMTTRWRARILARVVRKFEVLSCLKRVKAASEASKKVRHYFYCIKLMHEPSDRDLEAFHRSGTSLINEDPVDDRELEDEDDAVQAIAGTAGPADEKHLEEVGRILPQWNPDRSLTNTLLDVVHEAGIQGLTNRELRHNVTGIFVRRPVEHLLTRLTAMWLQSQPVHLRHLAIIRDVVLSGTLPVYVHYSYPNFEARVRLGLAFWEAVKGPATYSNKKGKKSSLANASITSVVPELDEFGFAADYTPASQFKKAQATLSQCLLAGQPDDHPLSNRDPTLYVDDDGSYKIKYDTAETSIRLVRPSRQDVIAPSGQDAVAPSEQEIVVPCRQDSVVSGSPATLPVAKQTKEKPPRPPKAPAKPKGRPRKFLRGTEKFWQGQFAMARMPANPDQHRDLNSRAGVMSDPAGLSLFADRPPQFDATLVRAIENGLPVPARPKDINQNWVDNMLQILNRDVTGVYVTPKGVQLQVSGKHKSVSRVLILRCPRLRELDFSQRINTPAVRFLTSSAAHTLPDLHNDFLGEPIEDSEDDIASSSPIDIREQTTVRDLDVGANQQRASPHEQLIDQSPGMPSNEAPAIRETGLSAAPATKRRRGRPRKAATVQGSESVPLSETGSNSFGGETLHPLESQATKTYLLDLPPALTTRSALREIKSGIGTDVLGNKVPPATSIEAFDWSNVVVVDTLPKSSDSGAQPITSKPIENETVLEGSCETEGRPLNVSAPAATPGISGLRSNRDVMTVDVVNLNENEPNHLGSDLPSSAPATMLEAESALFGGPTDSGKVHTSAADKSRLTPLEFDNHNSEAFRLVQELTADEIQQITGPDDTNSAESYLRGASQMVDQSTDAQKTLPELTVVNVDSDQEPPRKRSKQDGAGAGSVAILRRKIILDLMETCSGALPYTINSLWCAFTTAWQRSGQAGKPDVRTIKAVVKSLCQNGRAKQIKFSHRNKKGAMVHKTILAKSEMATSDPVIVEVQKKMIEADPRSYVPEALQIDPTLKRDVERQIASPWPAVFDDQTVDSSVTPAKVLRLQLRETLSRARTRQCRTGPSANNTDEEHVRGQVVPRTRLAGIRRKYARDSDSYQRPKLSMYHYPVPPQKPFSNQSAKSPRSLSFRTEVSQVPLTFEAATLQNRQLLESQASLNSPRDEDAQSAVPSSSFSTTSQAQQVRFVPVVWKKIGDQPVLPACLHDILLADRRKKKPDYSKSHDPGYREFEWIVDGVAKWECRSFNLFDSKSNNWAFINHSVGKTFQAAEDSESRITFDGLIWYDQSGREHTEKRFHGHALHPLGTSSRKILRERPQKAARKAPGKRQRSSSDLGAPAKKRRRGKSPLIQPQTITDSAGNLVDVSHLIGAKYKRARGTQHLRTMPEHLIYKLTMTIVVVRALVGGLEKHVDWPLVMSVFPDEDEQFLRDRWKTLSNKNRREIGKLSENLQNRFPDAYARGEIQPINFDDLESVDWKGIVQWALANLDNQVMHDIPDLPATRSEFNETINLRIESSPRPYRELFGYNQAVTVPIKEAAISATAFSVPLPSSSPSDVFQHPPHLVDPTDLTDDPMLTLAKSWALSTITTPLSTFNAAKARMKLQSLTPTITQSEILIKSAMRSLASIRALTKKRDKAVDAKGRSYDLSRVFTDTLDQRRTINATMLKQAVRYKATVLDPAFEKEETVRFDPVTVEDGDMVAILNLLANGRIRIKIGDDVSRNRWGIDQESRYQTRSIRKESLYFTVLIEQNQEKYVFGNPILEKKVPIPELGARDRDLIPIWRDINGEFQQDFWDLAIAAVLGLLASRPGATLREVSKMMSPALDTWEVKCLLVWCLELGAVKKTGEDEGGGWTGGWEVREWWWLTLGCVREDEDVQT